MLNLEGLFNKKHNKENSLGRLKAVRLPLRPITKCNTKAWRNTLVKVGITNFRWHDLRHTWASWHVMNGTSLQELMELGGWKSYEMVLRYAHLAPEHLANAAQRIERQWASVEKNPTFTLPHLQNSQTTNQ